MIDYIFSIMTLLQAVSTSTFNPC